MNLAGSGLVTTKLERARLLRPKVERRVRAFRSSNVVTKAVLAVSTADLSNPASKQSLLDFGPLIVRRLAMIAPQLALPVSSYTLADPYDDEQHRILVTLNEPARRAQAVLEDFFGIDLDEHLPIALRAVKHAISDRASGDISADFSNRGHYDADVSPPDGRMTIEVEHLTFDRRDQIFEIRGAFDADLSTAVSVVSDDGSTTDVLQGDALAHGTFTIQFWPDDSKGETLHIDDAHIDEWAEGPAPW